MQRGQACTWTVASQGGEEGGRGDPPRVTTSRGWHLDESVHFCDWICDHLKDGAERVGVVTMAKRSSLLNFWGRWLNRRSSLFWRKKVGWHHQLPHRVTPTLVTPLDWEEQIGRRFCCLEMTSTSFWCIPTIFLKNSRSTRQNVVTDWPIIGGIPLVKFIWGT